MIHSNRTRVRAWTLLVAGALAASALAGCSGTSNNPSESTGGDATTTLKFGFLGPLTGPSSTTGNDSKDGAQLAVDLANAEGLLPGVEVEMIVEDDKSTPEDAVVELQKVRGEGADVILGTVNSSVAIALSNALAGQSNYIYVQTASQTQTPLDEQTGNSLFGTGQSNATSAKALLGWISDEIKPEKVAFLGENSDFGVNELQQLQLNWTEPDDPEIVLTETFERTDSDYSAILSKVRDSGADSIYVGAGSGSIIAAIFQQADQLGLKVNKFMSSSLINDAFVAAAGSAAEGATNADLYHPAIENDENAAFIEAFQEAYGKLPNGINEVGFESVNLVLRAMKEAGTTTDLAAVADVMRAGTWATPRGELVFDDTGRAQAGTFVVGVRDGEITLVDTVQSE